MYRWWITLFGFPIGYQSTSQEVLIPAFLAAYTNRNAGAKSLNKFPVLPLPNWRITFDGLRNVKWINKFAKNNNFKSCTPTALHIVLVIT